MSGALFYSPLEKSRLRLNDAYPITFIRPTPADDGYGRTIHTLMNGSSSLLNNVES